MTDDDSYRPKSFEELCVLLRDSRRAVEDVALGCDFAIRSEFAKDEKTERDLWELQKASNEVMKAIDNFFATRKSRTN